MSENATESVFSWDQPSLQLKRYQEDVPGGLPLSQLGPSPGIDEVDQEDDLSFHPGPATLAMLAEYLQLSRRVTRSASASLRSPSPGAPMFAVPEKNGVPDMEPMPEVAEESEAYDSAHSTQEVEVILAGEETLYHRSAGSSVSQSLSGHAVSNRNGRGNADADQSQKKDVFDDGRMLGKHANCKAIPRSVPGIRLNSSLTSLDPSTPSPPSQAQRRYARSPLTVSPIAKNVNRPHHHHGPRGKPALQIHPIYPERVPARAQSPTRLQLFAHLDPEISQMLAKMARKFSFSLKEVLEKWDLNHEDLLKTHEILEKNRRFLDEIPPYEVEHD